MAIRNLKTNYLSKAVVKIIDRFAKGIKLYIVRNFIVWVARKGFNEKGTYVSVLKVRDTKQYTLLQLKMPELWTIGVQQLHSFYLMVHELWYIAST